MTNMKLTRPVETLLLSNTFETVVSDSGAVTAVDSDTLTIVGGAGISTNAGGSPKTLTITNTQPSPNGLSITTINGQPVLTLQDSTRSNKILSVAEQTISFSSNQLSQDEWISISDAMNALSGFIADFDGTVVFSTGHCSDTTTNTKNIHIFVNNTDGGTIGVLTGGIDTTFINTLLNVDFNRGDKIRLRAQQGVGGSIGDTVIKLTIKWRG